MAEPQQARVAVSGGDGAKMDAYPLLVQTALGPDGIRVASRSIRVTEILAARDADPQGDLKIRFGLAPEELDEVLRWDGDPEAPGKT